jgi:hypothetical protein
VQVVFGGGEGSVTSETPIYISLEASDIGGASDSEVCIAWLTSTSADSDFRSWNAATAAFCEVPWYPSTAQLPAVQKTYQPPCFWMSNDGRFVQGMSARLTDFFFPTADSSPASGTAAQWTEFPDTLCQAPTRQQSYNTMGGCMPFYPSGLDIVNHKNLTTGFDLDFEAVQSSYTLSCSASPEGLPLSADVPFNNCISLNPNEPAVCSPTIATNSDFTLPASITSQLKSDLTFGLGGGGGTPASVSAQGIGSFGGQIGEIPASPAAAAATELGIGNFGGVIGEIPASPTAGDTGESSSALDEIPASLSAAVTTQAADDPEISGLALGEMLGSELRAEQQSTEGGAQARARRLARLHQRASASLEHDKYFLATPTDTSSNEAPTITTAPSHAPRIKKGEQGGIPKKPPTRRMEPVLNRRIEKRGEEPHQWCKEGQLVVSEYSGHSALEVCQSSPSWGPDFVSIAEGIFCEMCERQSYPLCGEGSAAPGGSAVVLIWKRSS